MTKRRKTAIESIKCPRCGRKNELGGDVYESLEDYIEINGSGCSCRYCRGPLINMCSDSTCNTVNLPQARFCKRCGNETVFRQSGVFDEKFCKKVKKLVKERYGSERGRRRKTHGVLGVMDELALGVPLTPPSGNRSGSGRPSYLYGEKYPDWLQPRVVHPSMYDNGGSDYASDHTRRWDEAVWKSQMQYHGHHKNKSNKT